MNQNLVELLHVSKNESSLVQIKIESKFSEELINLKT